MALGRFLRPPKPTIFHFQIDGDDATSLVESRRAIDRCSNEPSKHSRTCWLQPQCKSHQVRRRRDPLARRRTDVATRWYGGSASVQLGFYGYLGDGRDPRRGRFEARQEKLLQR